MLRVNGIKWIINNKKYKQWLTDKIKQQKMIQVVKKTTTFKYLLEKYTMSVNYIQLKPSV